MNRLQQLAGITELEINKPISKKDIINYFLNHDVNTLESISYYPKEDYFREYGDGYDNENADHIIRLKYVEAYYKYFKPKEIDCSIVNGTEEWKNYKLPLSYKYLTCWGDNDAGTLIMLHNEAF